MLRALFGTAAVAIILFVAYFFWQADAREIIAADQRGDSVEKGYRALTLRRLKSCQDWFAN